MDLRNFEWKDPQPSVSKHTTQISAKTDNVKISAIDDSQIKEVIRSFNFFGNELHTNPPTINYYVTEQQLIEFARAIAQLEAK